MTGLCHGLGRSQWHSGLAEAGHRRRHGYTSHSFSPLVDGGRVIFHVGGKDKGALTAFDLATGEVRWSWAGDGPGYASPIVADLGGTRQIIVPTQAKLVSVDAATGSLLWERPLVHQFSSNAITPIVYGQTVIVAGTGPLMEIAVARRGDAVDDRSALGEYGAAAPLHDGGPRGRHAVRDVGTERRPRTTPWTPRSGKPLWTSDGRQAAHASIARLGRPPFSVSKSDGELVAASQQRPPRSSRCRRYKVADTETWAQPALSGNRIS